LQRHFVNFSFGDYWAKKQRKHQNGGKFFLVRASNYYAGTPSSMKK